MATPYTSDWIAFIESLNATQAEYLIIGGCAVAFHGYPRLTGDLDILVRPTVDNAERVVQALARFGFGSLAVKPGDLAGSDRILQLGVRPNRIGLVTSISGVSFEEVWARRVAGGFGDKLATGRSQDVRDAEQLSKRLRRRE
ncbi:MAG: hypothetical protein HY822_21780 [Acidobacteria bacterium]|nr:hypothetical protein [Acidobacteriota bacterium]